MRACVRACIQYRSIEPADCFAVALERAARPFLGDCTVPTHMAIHMPITLCALIHNISACIAFYARSACPCTCARARTHIHTRVRTCFWWRLRGPPIDLTGLRTRNEFQSETNTVRPHVGPCNCNIDCRVARSTRGLSPGTGPCCHAVPTLFSDREKKSFGILNRTPSSVSPLESEAAFQERVCLFSISASDQFFYSFSQKSDTPDRSNFHTVCAELVIHAVGHVGHFDCR